MADRVQRFAFYRIRNIERAEQEYYRSLIRTLDKIEKDVIALAGRELPTDKGKLIELRAAIAIRPKIRTVLTKEFLAWADTVTKQGYNRQAKRIERAFKEIGSIPIQFQSLTQGDLELIRNLKLQSFTQFQDVSNTFTKRLADKVYQSTLVGRDFVDLEEELRQTINGIYSRSNDEEANDLVDFINKNKNKKSKQSEVDKAVQTLQSKYARTRTGENLRRFAGQILNDGLREFDAQVNTKKALDAGLTHVKYFGDIIPTTRSICRNVINGVYQKRVGNIFTIEEVRKLWAQQSWEGKKPGDPLVVRGGYNCRHQWSYVNPDWYDDNGQLII
ncbi:MAG: hypothetical protein VW810_00550 [Pelagibacteraceae bacterium]